MRKTAKTSYSMASSSRPRAVHHQELRSGDFEESVFESEFEEQFEQQFLLDDAGSDEADTFSYPGTKRLKTVSCTSSPLKRSDTKYCLSGLKGKEKRVEPGRAVIDEDENRAGASGLLSRSKPIAIESSSHRSRSDSPDVLEHLSARGDIAGAFFPEHEDPSLRVHKPHHFGRDARKAKHQSLAEAAQAAQVSETFSFSSDDSIWKGREDRVIPTHLLKAPGFEHQGLYYPQNWTWRKQQKEERRRRRREEEAELQRRQRKSTTTSTATATASSSGAAAAGGAEPRTAARPRYPAAVLQICSISDSARRGGGGGGPGQQCQRNMVAQVAVDSTAVMKIRGDCSGGGSSSVSAATAALKTIILRRGGGGGGKPLSPRLAPLDDHGPVTPMNLEEEERTSYLSSTTTPQPPATKDRKGKGKADPPPQSNGNTRKWKGKERAFF